MRTASRLCLAFWAVLALIVCARASETIQWTTPVTVNASTVHIGESKSNAVEVQSFTGADGTLKRIIVKTSYHAFTISWNDILDKPFLWWGANNGSTPALAFGDYGGMFDIYSLMRINNQRKQHWLTGQSIGTPISCADSVPPGGSVTAGGGGGDLDATANNEWWLNFSGYHPGDENYPSEFYASTTGGTTTIHLRTTPYLGVLWVGGDGHYGSDAWVRGDRVVVTVQLGYVSDAQ